MVNPTTKPIPFFKMTGSGNDFIVIDNRSQLLDADRCRDFVQSVCRRKLSAGADGLILIENDPEVDFKWRFFNADGSEAEMCGNGARCAARFAYLNGIVGRHRMAFRTLAGIIHAELSGNRVKIMVSRPRGLQTDISLAVDGKPLRIDFLDTGVPHAVLFLRNTGELDAVDVVGLGRVVRHHTHFQPVGTNVNFAVVLNPNHMAVRTYERGVEEETLACGTGSIASALIAAAKGQVVSPVGVLTKSGETLTIHFQKEPRASEVEFSEVYLEGDAKVVYEAHLWDETLT